MSRPGTQEELHQAYLDEGLKLRQMARAGAEAKELARQRFAVDRAKAIWQKAVQSQRGAMRGRSR